MIVQWVAGGRSLLNVSLDTYEYEDEAPDPDDAGSILGRVICVSIFGTATVTAFRATYADAAPDYKDLTFVRADVSGSYRSEVWYLPNTIQGKYILEPTFSSATDSVLGTSAYKYFGGIGTHGGATGTGDPASKAITPNQADSIVLASLVTETASGILNAIDQNNRWELFHAAGSSMGSDKGPVNPITSTTLQFDGITAGHVWVVSSVEVLTYQDNPPGIMGM